MNDNLEIAGLLAIIVVVPFFCVLLAQSALSAINSRYDSATVYHSEPILAKEHKQFLWLDYYYLITTTTRLEVLPWEYYAYDVGDTYNWTSFRTTFNSGVGKG